MLPLVLVLVVVGLVALAIAVLTRPPPPTHPNCKLDEQSVLLPGPERIRRSPFCLNNELMSTKWPHIRTLHDAFRLAAEKWPERPCLGTRRGEGGYEWQSYRQVYQRALDLGSGLQELGLAAGQQGLVGIYAPNRAEWIVAEQAANAFGQMVVPLYDTLGAEAVQFIINQAEIPVVVCDAAKLPLLLGAAPECRSLRVVVKMGEVTEEEAAQWKKVRVALESMADVEARGKRSPHKTQPPKPDDVCTICYTSGTTGDPKGVMLTHLNLVADMSAGVHLLENSNFPHPTLHADDVHLSYLPLAHIFEREIFVWIFACGARAGFYRGDPKLLMEDLKELRPTIFPTVPRLLNRVYGKVMSGVQEAGGVKKALFDMALAAKTKEVQRGILRSNSVWDFLVFRKIQNGLGGRVRVIITGAAPIQGKVLTFFKAALGIPVCEGYGQTETGAAATITLPGDPDVSHVGPPMACNEIKLVSVDEMGYFANEDKGEICVRGTNVMAGYYKNPEKTSEAIDKHGWLHTGDIGMWLPNGTLRVVDRKKSIFKLAQGEYVAPEKIENVYTRAEPVAQAFVYGKSTEAHLVGLMVLDHEHFEKWAAKKVPEAKGSLEEMAENPAVVKAVLDEILAVGKQHKLASFEQVRAIYLVSEPFTVENNMLTPTFKARRPQIESKYKQELEKLYEESARPE